MNDDIFESVSQGSNGAYDEENRRIQEVSNELQRLCQLHEAQPRDGNKDGKRFNYLNKFHKESVERKLKKIEKSLEKPMDPVEAAKYMWHNYELAKNM